MFGFGFVDGDITEPLTEIVGHDHWSLTKQGAPKPRGDQQGDTK